MIIEISDEFADFDELKWRPYAASLEHLITAHCNGWHILTPSRKVARGMVERCNLSVRQLEILQFYIVDKIAVLVGQARTADATILAVPDDYEGRPSRDNQIVVRLRTFDDMSACLQAQLLTENSAADGKYILTLANLVARDLGYGVGLSLELVHGGGAGTAVKYKEMLESNRPALCVVDSDRTYPSSALGSTAKAIVKQGMSNEGQTVQAKILPVREIENTIPISFLLQVYGDNLVINRKIGKICKYISSLKTVDCPFYVLDYLDLKGGDTVDRVQAFPEPDRTIFIRACNVLNDKNVDWDAVVPNNNIAAYDGISVNLLQFTMGYLQNNPRLDREFAAKLRKAPFWLQLEHLIRLILSFGAASSRIPA